MMMITSQLPVVFLQELLIKVFLVFGSKVKFHGIGFFTSNFHFLFIKIEGLVISALTVHYIFLFQI